MAGVLVVLAGQGAGAVGHRRRASRRAQRALGLGDDLVGDHEHVAGLVGRRRAAARRGRRRGAPRAGRAQRPAPARELIRRSRRASSPRVCAAPPVRASSTTRSAARSSAVSTSSTSERGSATRQRAPPAARRLLVALAAAGAEAGGDRVGRRQQQRVGARAVAVGDDDDVGRAHRAGHQLVDLARVQRRAVAGHEQHALVVALERPVDAGPRGVRVAAVVVGDRLGVVGAGQRLGAVLAGDHDHLVDPLGAAQRVQHVADHGLGQRPAGAGVERLVQALLGVVEALDRQHRAGPHRTEPPRSAGRPRPGAGARRRRP